MTLIDKIKSFNVEEIKRLQSILEDVCAEKEKKQIEHKTIGAYKDLYEEYIQNTFSPSYLRSVCLSFKQIIKYFGADRLMIDITVMELEKFKAILYNRAPGGASTYLRTLKAAFSKAVDWELIPSNPFLKIQIKKIQRNKPTFIDREELNRILQFTKKSILRLIFIFSIETGCRLGEILGLKWSAIDLVRGIITVGDKELITKSKKTRIIPMTNRVKDLLVKLEQGKSGDERYIFSKADGFPYNRDYVSRAFKKARRAAGLKEEIHFHTLRHSFGSGLGLSGTPITVIKDLMGHSSLTVTEIYCHTNLESLKAGIARIENNTGHSINTGI